MKRSESPRSLPVTRIAAKFPLDMGRHRFAGPAVAEAFESGRQVGLRGAEEQGALGLATRDRPHALKRVGLRLFPGGRQALRGIVVEIGLAIFAQRLPLGKLH